MLKFPIEGTEDLGLGWICVGNAQHIMRDVRARVSLSYFMTRNADGACWNINVTEVRMIGGKDEIGEGVECFQYKTT